MAYRTMAHHYESSTKYIYISSVTNIFWLILNPYDFFFFQREVIIDEMESTQTTVNRKFQ